MFSADLPVSEPSTAKRFKAEEKQPTGGGEQVGEVQEEEVKGEEEQRKLKLE